MVETETPFERRASDYAHKELAKIQATEVGATHNDIFFKYVRAGYIAGYIDANKEVWLNPPRDEDIED